LRRKTLDESGYTVVSANLLNLLADLLLRPKVAGSLPGKMHVSIPILKHVRERMVPEGIYETMADLFRGVDSFTPNYSAGTILVQYDPDATNERVILSSIKTVTKTVIAYRGRLFRVPAGKRDIVWDRLREHLATVDADQMSQERELDLPDEIWSQ
jgi:hypothetical protein